MNYIKVGKIVNTHGIKGEIRIINEFKEKELIYKKDMIMYIGSIKEKVIINSYRHHKIYEMITLKGFNDINEVLKFKGEYIYIDRDDIDEDIHLVSDLIGMTVNDDYMNLGVVYEIVNNYTLLHISGEKDFYIPLNSPYIKEIDYECGVIETNRGRDLIL